MFPLSIIERVLGVLAKTKRNKRDRNLEKRVKWPSSAVDNMSMHTKRHCGFQKSTLKIDK